MAGILARSALPAKPLGKVPPEPPRRRGAAGGTVEGLRAERGLRVAALAGFPPHADPAGEARNERRRNARAATARAAARARSPERRRQGGACRERGVAVTRAPERRTATETALERPATRL